MGDAVKRGKISGNGHYTRLCHDFFQERYGFRKCLLTTSCTDALEMSAILLDIEPGDEVIVPSYTFVSSANAFVLRGAKIVFADSSPDHPNLDATILEGLITPNTKAIVVVHYAGMACDMTGVMELADKHNVFVVEDAAQAVDSYFTERGDARPLGSMGHLGAMSFHETKNIISGEGGMLMINDERFVERAEIIWEKGTNRASFFRGEVDKYGWVDVGSSFLMSELNAAYLYGQLMQMESIQHKRVELYHAYKDFFSATPGLVVPDVPDCATANGHMFFALAKDLDHRSRIIKDLKSQGLHAVFHYLSLHKSPVQSDNHDGRDLVHSDRYTDCLLRFPLYPELDFEAVEGRLKRVEFDD